MNWFGEPDMRESRLMRVYPCTITGVFAFMILLYVPILTTIFNFRFFAWGLPFPVLVSGAAAGGILVGLLKWRLARQNRRSVTIEAFLVGGVSWVLACSAIMVSANHGLVAITNGAAALWFTWGGPVCMVTYGVLRYVQLHRRRIQLGQETERDDQASGRPGR